MAFLRHFCSCPVPFGAVLELKPDGVHCAAASHREAYTVCMTALSSRKRCLFQMVLIMGGKHC